jgi:hypothetical protein
MISSYTLGDLVLGEYYAIIVPESLKDKILIEHPNSFGSKFITEKRKNNSNNNIDIITKIVLDYLDENSDFLPKDISESTVIHLRLGDVIAGNEWHEKSKRPLSVEHIRSLVKNDTNKKYIIGKCFFASPSSTNYSECIQKSNEYLHNVMNEIQAEHLNSENADIDLCCAVKSKLFIQGKGFFSKLIVEIRKKCNLNSIETNVHL